MTSRLFAILLCLPCLSIPQAAGTARIAVNPADGRQVIQGFGLNFTAPYFRDDQKAMFDMAIDDLGVTMWRVVPYLVYSNWEETNDNNDPAVMNWEYYDERYSGPAFEASWKALRYLNSRGAKPILALMGPVPEWMVSEKWTRPKHHVCSPDSRMPALDPAKYTEFAEMVVSMAVYARRKAGVDFEYFSPFNESDCYPPEGPRIDPEEAPKVLDAVAGRLAAEGLGDVRLTVADNAVISNDYTGPILRDDDLMKHVAALAVHDYGDGSVAPHVERARNSKYPQTPVWLHRVRGPERSRPVGRKRLEELLAPVQPPRPPRVERWRAGPLLLRPVRRLRGVRPPRDVLRPVPRRQSRLHAPEEILCHPAALSLRPSWRPAHCRNRRFRGPHRLELPRSRIGLRDRCRREAGRTQSRCARPLGRRSRVVGSLPHDSRLELHEDGAGSGIRWIGDFHAARRGGLHAGRHAGEVESRGEPETMVRPRPRPAFGLLCLRAVARPARSAAPQELLRAPRVERQPVSSSATTTASASCPARRSSWPTFSGPGVVTHIWFTVADNEFAWPRLVRLRVYYDGKKTPSVDAPLGDFFGVGHGYERDLDSMMVRDSSFGRARNSYWPMPFRRSCRITVTNEGNRPVTMFYYHVDWQKHASLPDDTAYFHAYYRQERPAVSGNNYEFLNVKGSGHYVGTVLNVMQTGVGWFGEGDDLFYVDGAKYPQIFGTGTEDYFNDAWGLRVSYGPWTGLPWPKASASGARLTGYRWHVPDPDSVHQIDLGRHRAPRLDLQRRRQPAVRLRRAPRLLLERRLLVSDRASTRNCRNRLTATARLPVGNAQQIAVEDSLADVRSRRARPPCSGSGLGQGPALLRSGRRRVPHPHSVRCPRDWPL